MMGVAAACVGGLAATRERTEGPPLFWAPGPGTATGFSTYARHLLAGTAAGVDFALTGARSVHPMAGGTVALVGEDAVSGKYIILDHGFYQTRYAHLASVDVRVGDGVRRDQTIATGGATGLGALLGPHLHVDLHADALYVAYLGGPEPTHPLIWLDPVSFAVTDAVDSAGNSTLPYYNGHADLDGPHRRLWHTATGRVSALVRRLPASDAPPGGPASIGFPEGAPGPARTFREGLRRLHAAYMAGVAPTGSTLDETADAIKDLLAVRPRLTAPLSDLPRALPA